MADRKRTLAGLAVGSLLVGMAATANAGDIRQDHSDTNDDMVITGAYRCPGNFVGGLQHAITFNTTDGADLSIETEFLNLDTGDCTPRGKNAIDVARRLGCTAGPVYAFQRGGGPGAAFGFVCNGERSAMVKVIQKLSAEILRPTTVP